MINTSIKEDRPLIIGGGIGGLTAALELALAGQRPLLLEREAQVGGKAHQVKLGPHPHQWVDGGPTVMTMIHVFEELFARAGTSLDDELVVTPAETLARHFWSDGSRLDLFTDLDRSREAIRVFAGEREADAFIKFHRYAERIYQSVSDIFIFADKPSPLKMMAKMGPSIAPRMLHADVHRRMWSSICRHFKDERLRQLFGRYATYSGNNPFKTPGTFNLISAVEQRGVWRVRGGISALAESLKALIIRHGGEVQTGVSVRELLCDRGAVSGVQLTTGEVIPCKRVIFNGDVQALSSGLLGPQVQQAVSVYPRQERSLSALTLCAMAQLKTAPLLHHNVWFSDDYRREFEELERGRLPSDPTLYLCAQDRGDSDHDSDRDRDDDSDLNSDLNEREFSSTPQSSPLTRERSKEPPYERLFALVNAPARADDAPISQEESSQCQAKVMHTLTQLGALISPTQQHWSDPQTWHRRFPGSGGAIYGQATTRWNSNLERMGAQSKVKGLYLAGGSVHPGAGVPMAAISGRLAAQRLIQGSTSTA